MSTPNPASFSTSPRVRGKTRCSRRAICVGRLADAQCARRIIGHAHRRTRRSQSPAAGGNRGASQNRDGAATRRKNGAAGQLTGGIAHDFNDLPTVIFGNLELLSEAVSSGKSIDAPCLQRMMGAAQNAASQTARPMRRRLVLSRRNDPRSRPTRIDVILSGLDEFVRRALGEGILFGLFIETKDWSCPIPASD